MPVQDERESRKMYETRAKRKRPKTVLEQRASLLRVRHRRVILDTVGTVVDDEQNVHPGCPCASRERQVLQRLALIAKI